MSTENWTDTDPLCCCEYFDKNQERNHILACCCNCHEFDDAVDRVVRCQSVQMAHLNDVFLKMQDRLRIPWRGGAKQVLCDAVFPVIMIPILGFVAALNVWLSVIVFLTLPVLINLMRSLFMRNNLRTKFFFMWTVTSVVSLLLIFELLVVPLLEILLEENLALMICLIGALFSAYKVKTQASLSHVKNNDVPETEQVEIKCEELENTNLLSSEIRKCPICKKCCPPRAFHCNICQVCILKKEYHCLWFDCCIGESNRKTFVLFLVFAVAALTYGSNLILTTVCFPYPLYGTILLPYDCSEVYYEYDTALCFVSGVYCTILAIMLFFLLAHQCWLISLGLTGCEWKSLVSSKMSVCLLPRPYSRGFFSNWSHFCKRN